MNNSRPTIADVARRAGVSTATVSRVLNGTALVEPETARRVQTAVEDLQYIPHAAARMLASRRTNTLGLLLPEIGGAFFQPMLRGVETAASAAGFDLLIHTTRSPASGPARRRPLAEHNTDGLLVFTGSLDGRELARLAGNGFPVVLLHQTPPDGLSIPSVSVENQSGARALVDHLIEVHHRRRIVFLQGPTGHEDSNWREKGYREALQAHGIPFDPALVRSGGFNREEAQRTMTRLLRQGLPFDAVFAGDDDAAVGVLQALRQTGRLVPQQVAVAGFDDQVFSSTLEPPLTTVRAPTEEVGQQAVHLLLRCIQSEAVPVRLILPTCLVLRASCGCSPN